MAKRKKKDSVYPNKHVQRNSAKWRISGVAGNLKAIKREHDLVLNTDEIEELATAENIIRKLLDRF
jgi:hypothetical protein